MWIQNKMNGTIQEIHNADVIKICRKEPDKYIITEEYPANGVANDDSKKSEESLKEKTENDVGDADKEENKNPKEELDVADTDYDNMKINDLRKIAKEKGIQGYMNMDKATLAAVIQVH